jgi:hypothetical protein
LTAHDGRPRVAAAQPTQRADESAETLVFALSRVELWALERLAKEFERQLAAAATRRR